MGTTSAGETSPVHARGLRAAAARVADPFAFTLLAILVFWWWLVLAVQGSPADWAFDFRQFWQGGNDVVAGLSPYPTDAQLASAGDHLDPEGIREVFRFPYPAGALALLAPFGLLEFHAAAAVWSAGLIVTLFAGLWILRVRDWRVLAIVVTSAPVISAVRLGTMTPLLVLLLAVAWRWRDRRWIVGSSLAAAIALKLFLWPMVVWLVATRRFVAAVIALALATVVTLTAWAAIGFDGFRGYPELVRRLSDVVADRGYSLVALGVEAGVPRAAAELLPWIIGIALVVAVVHVARRADGDHIAHSLAVVAALALTPIVWLHYFALLVLPLARMGSRGVWPWLLLWAFWITPTQENQGDLWRVLLAAALTAAAVAALSVSRAVPAITKSRRDGVPE